MPITVQPVSVQEKITNLLHNVRKLAPAPDRTSVLMTTPDRCKKRVNYASFSGAQPASVARRNARERNRVKQVNNGFATLRQHIPTSVSAAVTGGGRGASKKLSKVDTLKLAVEYIRSLQQLLDDHDSETGSVHPADVGYDNGYSEYSEYYADSPDSAQHAGHGLMNHTPPSSEPSVSPSPSFTSENSPSLPMDHGPKGGFYQTNAYENYEPTSTEDEELLDVIYWWQQQ